MGRRPKVWNLNQRKLIKVLTYNNRTSLIIKERDFEVGLLDHDETGRRANAIIITCNKRCRRALEHHANKKRITVNQLISEIIIHAINNEQQSRLVVNDFAQLETNEKR